MWKYQEQLEFMELLYQKICKPYVFTAFIIKSLQLIEIFIIHIYSTAVLYDTGPTQNM